MLHKIQTFLTTAEQFMMRFDVFQSSYALTSNIWALEKNKLSKRSALLGTLRMRISSRLCLSVFYSSASSWKYQRDLFGTPVEAAISFDVFYVLYEPSNIIRRNTSEQRCQLLPRRATPRNFPFTFLLLCLPFFLIDPTSVCQTPPQQVGCRF